jgi:phospho-N-acetylmuramoyl-pentapeptide-transferase
MLYWLLENLRGWLLDVGVYSLFSVLDQIEFRALAAAGLAFAIVAAMGKPTIRWLVRKKIGDSGLTDAAALQGHTSSKAKTPTMGGILIVGAIVLSTLLLADIRSFYVQLGLVVIVWLAALGGIDDWLKLTAATRAAGSRQGLHAWEKLVFQLGLGVLVGWFLFHKVSPDGSLQHVLTLPFQKTYVVDADGARIVNPGLIYFGLGAFVLWATLFLAGLSNAANITDGMDGLAGGITVAVCVGLFVLTLISGNQGFAQHLLVPYIPEADELSILAGATAGACVGFLWFNCSPAQVFMGDTGSLSLGGVVAYIALVTRQELVVLLMCGVFLVEIASVVIQVGYFKYSGGKRVFRCAPFHHHLHLGGWTEQQVVARMWIISIILVVTALASLKIR